MPMLTRKIIITTYENEIEEMIEEIEEKDKDKL